MRIAQSETRDKFPLSTKKVLKKTVMGTLVWAILLLIIWGVLAFALSSSTETGSWFGIATIGIFGLLFLIILIVYLYQRWYYAVYFYDLTPDYIVIKKGPITPREITIPYERVQDVYVDQDLLDRIFGLYDVHLSSATISSGMVPTRLLKAVAVSVLEMKECIVLGVSKNQESVRCLLRSKVVFLD